jgi:hypothetical protein
LGLSGGLYDYYDEKISEMVARLAAVKGHAALAQIRQESGNVRIFALLGAIGRHAAAFSSRSAWRGEEDFTSGTDGSREMLALDCRSEPSPVVLVDVVFSGWDDAIWQAPDLAAFLREYPERGVRRS